MQHNEPGEWYLRVIVILLLLILVVVLLLRS